MSVGVIAGNAASVTVISATLTPSAVSTITAPAQTFTVPGLKVGDLVSVTPPSITAGAAICNARVSADDTLSIQFVNPTVGSVTPAAGLHEILVIRKDQTVAKVLT